MIELAPVTSALTLEREVFAYRQGDANPFDAAGVDGETRNR
jgi:hypothetical protein